MKTTLLLVSTAVFLLSCDDTSKIQSIESLPDEEMKSRVKVEEILFDEPTTEIIASVNEKTTKNVDTKYRGCILEPGCLGEGLVELPELVGCGRTALINPEDEKVFEIPQVDAQFPGGIVEFKKYLLENIRYPDLDICDQGTVYVSMVIGKDGKIRDEKIIRGVSEEFDQEALRVIHSMPNWIPAENNGKIIATRVRLPVRFTLN